MKVKELPIEQIKPYPRNPRKNEAAVEPVANSIKAFGFRVPIVLDRDGVIVAGHTRLEAAKRLGMDKVPCVVADDLTEEQAKAFRLADNKTAELALWDVEMLADELADISDFDMREFGFDGGTDEEPKDVQEDDFDEEPPAEPKAKRGEIYRLGAHRLMCGDSTSAEDVARLMDGAKADMVFTDPPYNVAIGSKNKFLNSIQKAERCTEDIANDKGLTDEEIGKTLWLPAFQNMYENAKDECSIYVTMPQGGTHMMMMMMMMSSCWQVKHELIWVKNSPTFSMGRLDYDYQHEPIAYGWKKTHCFYGKGKYNKSLWHFDKPKKCDLHPTMKPVELIGNALENSSKENDAVLDLFGGSGSTLIACEQLNRKCYMMELDARYIDVIIDRWEKFTGRKAEKIAGGGEKDGNAEKGRRHADGEDGKESKAESKAAGGRT